MVIQPKRSLASLFVDQLNARFLDTAVLEGVDEVVDRDHPPFPDMSILIETEVNLWARPSFRSVRVTTQTADQLEYALSRLTHVANYELTFSNRLGKGEEFLPLGQQIGRIREAEEMWSLLKGSGIYEFAQSNPSAANLEVPLVKGALDMLEILQAVFIHFDEHHSSIYDIYSVFRTLFLTKVRGGDAVDDRQRYRDRKDISEDEMEGLRNFLRDFLAPR